jgi:preprotein translocase subunit SecA
VTRMCLLAELVERPKERENISSNRDGNAPAKKQPVQKTAEQKTGRNDPCPCASGKKYKNCCGKN